MRRRQFITLLGGAAAAWPLAARAQQPERMRRIGMLSGLAADDPEGQARFAAFAQGLQQLGWIDGRNVRIDIRSAAGNVDDARKYAAELVALAPRRSGGWAEETLPDTYPISEISLFLAEIADAPMIGGHNLLDSVRPALLGAAAPVWNVLHQPGLIDLGVGLKLFTLYPLIPWIGVMAAGYALGPVFTLERAARLRWLIGLGAAVTTGFVLLRATNLYGDPASWTVHDNLLATVLSFINCEKYPPSLLYLAMTLGPALLLLAAFEDARGRLAAWIVIFGRVPFFYYIAHLFLIHALALAFAWATNVDTAFLLGAPPPAKPAGYGLGLAGVYAVWLAVIVALYPACRWFAAVKQRRSDWWWSYL